MKSRVQTRRKILALFGAVGVVVAASASAWWFVALRGYESTDDAYVSGNIVPVMSQVEGHIEALFADDTRLVKVGMPLVALDQTDAKLALTRSETRLAQAVRQTQQQMIELKQFDATIAQRQAELDRLLGDQSRREGKGMATAIGEEDLLHARQGVIEGKAALQVAIYQRNALQARLKDTPLALQPEVRTAAEALRQDWLNLQRTRVLSPVSGIVAKRSVQVGSYIDKSSPLMVIVPLDQLWVDANFKEVQVARFRVGQPVELTADYYGDEQVYHGEVEGLAAGTGSVFSLLPAQNATGNWLKVVQRLPVRIRLHADELKAHPLRVGLSMQVRVDVHDTTGPQLVEVANQTRIASTPVLTVDTRDADALIQRIIVDNSQLN